MPFNKNKLALFSILALSCLGAIGYFFIIPSSDSIASPISLSSEANILPSPEIPISEEIPKASVQIPVSHIKTPEPVKALYMSSWVAGSPKFRETLVSLIDKTELNAVVIDIKDSTGRISFIMDNPKISDTGAPQKRIPNISALLDELHKKNIYVIGRISVFQDPYMTEKNPEWAVTRKSDGKVWKDRKGLSFLEPTNKDVWDYITTLSLDSYALGFDELNFDYIRYPSDGNIEDINYRLEPGKTRSDNLEEFFKHLSSTLKMTDSIPISADLFGLTTEATDDMGIGQVWEKAIPYFDFVAPMVYPSHYPKGSHGFKNPASFPYEIITKALESGIAKNNAMIPAQDIHKIRPWIQDFNLGAEYTAPMIKAQMKAVYDQNLTSWMLWDPKNRYTPSALMPDPITNPSVEIEQ